MPCRSFARWGSRAIFVATACLVTAVAHADSKVVVVEPDSQVTLRGQVGSDGSFHRSFRVKLEGADSATIHILTSDLVNGAGNLIDRRSVTVTGDLKLTGEERDLEVNVTGVAASGEYTGSIDLIPEHSEHGSARLTVKLEARPAAIALAPETKTFAVKLAKPCNAFTNFVLGTTCKAGTTTYTAFLVSDGGKVPAGSTELFAIGPNGVSLDGKGAATIVPDKNRLELKLDPAALEVGQYSGRVVARFQGVTSPLEVPLDIQVRIGPVWPLVAMVLGVLVGQLARIMREYGDQQAALRLRFNRLLARVSSLPVDSQDALRDQQQIADRAIDQQANDAATAEVTNFETAFGVLEGLERSRRHPRYAAVNNGRDVQIVNAVSAGDITAAKTTLDQLRTALSAPPQANMALPRGGQAAHQAAAAAVAAAAIAAQQRVIDWWNVFVQYLARPLLKVVLLVLLVYVGLLTLYVDGSATFGSRRLVDLLALFTWGLSSDVASRTLANIRG